MKIALITEEITKEYLEKEFSDVESAIWFCEDGYRRASSETAPKRPILPELHSAIEAFDYAIALDNYEKIELPAYKETLESIQKEQTRIINLLIDYIKEKSGLYDKVPVKYADKLFKYVSKNSVSYDHMYKELFDLAQVFAE